MKHTLILLITLPCSLFPVPYSLSAAVPLSWTVETSRATPATFEAYQGETIQFEAALQSHGKPLEMSGLAAFFWQTNGMGSAYWQTSAAVNSNRLSAVFTPEMDVGAKVYNCFIGSPSNIYHAAFQLRLRPSPGAIPNVLPLPVPILDFAKVRVLNPPWPTGGTDTNAVIDIIHETVDGAARPLPKYLHTYDADDSYPDAAQEYYRSRGDGKVDGGCSAVRRGGFLYRNFDYPFDDRAEFVVHMSSGSARFASVGVAQVGTNLTEQMVTSGKWSKWYKALPGATVDGINENGVVVEINVVDTPVTGWHTNATDKAIHPLAAPRWVLDHATNAQHGAEYIAANIRFPQGWVQNFHYMIADAEKTYIVENGTVTDGDEYHEPDEPVTMTNFQLSKFPWGGMGMERFGLLLGGANITNAWYTNAYRRETNPPWVSDLAEVLAYTNAIFDAWASHDKEYFRGKTNNSIPWWQTVHTSIYDITNRTLRISVQETDDWYVFAVDAHTSSLQWTAITGKPDTFPPSSHTHTKAQITDFPTAMTPTAHASTHATGEIDEITPASIGALEANHPQLGPPGGQISWGDNGVLNILAGNINAEAAAALFNVVNAPYGILTTMVQGSGGYLYLNSGMRIGSIYVGDNKIGNDDALHFQEGSNIVFDDQEEDIDQRIARLAPVKPNTVTNLVNAAVSANLNTYIDGETGVEYVGKFYGGSLYYVPTGNVYPPNN